MAVMAVVVVVAAVAEGTITVLKAKAFPDGCLEDKDVGGIRSFLPRRPRSHGCVPNDADVDEAWDCCTFVASRIDMIWAQEGRVFGG